MKKYNVDYRMITGEGMFHCYLVFPVCKEAKEGQEQFLSYFPLLRKLGYPIWDINPLELHILLSAYSTALFEPVTHRYSLEEALHCLDTVEAFFVPGWKKLLGL